MRPIALTLRAGLLAVLLWSGWTPAIAQVAAPDGWTAKPMAGGTLVQPADLPEGSQFAVWVAPPVALSARGVDAQQAFTQIAEESLRSIGAAGHTQCEPAQLAGNGTITQDCALPGGASAGGALSIQTIMLPLRAGARAHWLRVTAAGPTAKLAPYAAGFGNVMSQVSARWAADPGAASAPRASARPAAPPAASSAAPTRDEDIARAVRTAPGKGAADKDIAAVLFTWAQAYRVTGVQYEETIYLLMKDGSAYEALAIPPHELDVEASRRLQPSRWVSWRKQGDTYQMKSATAKDWTAVKGWPAIPGARDERLTRTYLNAWYASYGGLGGASRRTSLIFKGDGRYESVGISTFGTGGVQANNGFAAGSTGTHSASGSQGTSSISAAGAGAGGSTTRRNDGAEFTGRYRIDGWTIEFQRDNGTVERQLFLFSNEAKDAINIGGRAFTVPKQ